MTIRRTKKTKASIQTNTPFLDMLRINKAEGKRGLTTEERRDLVLMLAHKSKECAFDIDKLAPPGSFPRALLRHFDNTDISYAMPLFQLTSIAAAWLTQHGAYLEVAGAGRIRPTTWTTGLAESGSSKTLAADRVWKILSDVNGAAPVNKLGMVSTDAQWIIDLSENNGAFWLQDEVGKFIREMNTSTKLTRLKAWMLDSYSSMPIGNRLKGEAQKLVIEDPHFTFHGMTVLSTWGHDVNATSMLDGFCQRMNYYVAPARTDTCIFDHFIYFEGADVAGREQELRETWQALCAQPNAAGRYDLKPEALNYLVAWWKSLQRAWGDFALPASFLRRIGFSVLRYLIIVQFLLGKSRLQIDVETASIATAYAEYHMESALLLIQSYDGSAANHVRRVATIHQEMQDDGEKPTARNIARRLSKAARQEVNSDMIKEIMVVLEQVEKEGPAGFVVKDDPKQKSATILTEWQQWLERMKLNERKRNERRLRELRRAHPEAKKSCMPDQADNVIEFPAEVKPAKGAVANAG